MNIYKYNFMRKLTTKHKTKEELHKYWKNPCSDNYPESYLKDHESSALLIREFQNRISKDDKILEIGCNVGRNLNALYNEGYKNLTGIEINPTAIKIMKQEYPEMEKESIIINLPVEEAITKFKDNHFNVIFTMAVLEHIPKESEWIFKEMVRITKKIITIEDEKNHTWRHFPRNYKKMFQPHGIREVSCCKKLRKPLKNFKIRYFAKYTPSR